MIRKLVLPALTAALLAGCVTDYGAYGVGVRGGYYGNPSIEFRYDSGYLMYPYGYGGYGTYGYPYRYYGAPYGYGGGYYGGYYGYPFYRPYYPYYRHHHGHRPPGAHPGYPGYPRQYRRDDDRRPPWRNYDQLRRGPGSDGGGAAAQSRPPLPVVPLAEPRERGGSRMEQTVRRANRNAATRVEEQEP